MQMRGALLLLPVAALLLTPTPSAATPALSAPGTAPLLALVSLAVWACCGWLLLVAMLTLGAARTGRLAAPARGLLRRLAPPAVRSAARLALGVTLTVTALGSSPASAASSG